MILNKVEFYLMNNPLRALVQEKYEVPLLLKMSKNKTYVNGLEIGCGNGSGAKLIKKYFAPNKLVSIDLDDKMIELARRSNNDNSVEFKVMDASKLEFPEDTFDVIFDFGIIHHIPNWNNCLNELRRVLKKDGELILEELSIESFTGFPGIIWKKVLYHPYENMFKINEFEDHLKKIGFQVVEKRTCNPLKLLKYFFLVAVNIK